jgi:hypothetical protein
MPRAVFRRPFDRRYRRCAEPASSEFIRDMNTIGPIQGDRITVGAGATWRSVVTATVRAGLTPPVLTPTG